MWVDEPKRVAIEASRLGPTNDSQRVTVMDKRTRSKGMVAGAICFLAFAMPHSALFWVDLAMNGYQRGTCVAWLVVMAIYAAVGSLLGVGVARRSRVLMILASVLVVSILGVWVYGLAFHGFDD